ncbi:MAG: hypothetical protein ISR91_07840, partial [Candidatus Delongbacteria bacterium]|nr:hypothetical protein [Candidatus Delongbacteria bacterium]
MKVNAIFGLLLLLVTVSGAQDLFEMEITTEAYYDVNGIDVELFELAVTRNGEYQSSELFRIDGNWVMSYGYLPTDGGDPVFWAAPYTLVKTGGLVVGESWVGIFSGMPTLEEALQEVEVTVGAGTFNSWEIAFIDSAGSSFDGSRWFATQVGQVQFFYQNDDDDFLWLYLESYSLQGGYGYMPLAVGNYWTYSAETPEHIQILNPDRIALMQNHPNPFNPSTTIEFTLLHPQRVELTVYNL